MVEVPKVGHHVYLFVGCSARLSINTPAQGESEGHPIKQIHDHACRQKGAETLHEMLFLSRNATAKSMDLTQEKQGGAGGMTKEWQRTGDRRVFCHRYYVTITVIVSFVCVVMMGGAEGRDDGTRCGSPS